MYHIIFVDIAYIKKRWNHGTMILHGALLRKDRRSACEQKDATVLPNRTAAP